MTRELLRTIVAVRKDVDGLRGLARRVLAPDSVCARPHPHMSRLSCDRRAMHRGAHADRLWTSRRLRRRFVQGRR